MTIAGLNAHLQTAATHVCHCWAVTRKDSVTFGFTDHDRPLVFDAVTFKPDSGLSAKAITSTTGLSVNNTEALGVLSADAVTDADLEAGRFDGASVTMWLVCWDDVTNREVKFAGSIGEIVREAGTYRAELRGLTEQLNQPQGRAFLRSCSAVLGDAGCKVDTDDPAYRVQAVVAADTDGQVLRFDLPAAFTDRWFEGGIIAVQTGDAAGLQAVIKRDDHDGAQRVMTLWRPLPAPIAQGDIVVVTAGCDKRSKTCRIKFDNLINFQGFPDIPGDDWLMRVPRASDDSTGGSLSR